MASTLNEDIGAFLDDAVTALTNLHVKAAQYAGQPDVQAAFGDLASVPGALIEQAQQLRARLDDEGGEPFFTEDAKGLSVISVPEGFSEDEARSMAVEWKARHDEKPKAKKPAASKR